jgi:hypothetical protein
MVGVSRRDIVAAGRWFAGLGAGTRGAIIAAVARRAMPS